MYKMLSVMLFSGMLHVTAEERSWLTIPANVKELTGYKLRDKVISLNDYNLWVIANEETFDRIFVADTTTTARPDFDKELVLAAKVITAANSYKVKFKTVIEKDETLNVYFSIQRNKKEQEDTGAAFITVYPKSVSVKKVNFYHDNRLVRTVPMVAVY